MKLEYKVLWFEDQFDEVEGDIEQLEELVEDHGFVPTIIRKKSITEKDISDLSDQLYNYNPYDLIIFDYELGSESASGLVIAKTLRSKIYTDMIFYSGAVASTLKKKLFDDDIQGVFVVGRPTFFDDIQGIVEDHIKRMSDINNIRGVVMAATSSMDTSLREILIAHTDEFTPEERQSVLDEIKERLEEGHGKVREKLDGLNTIEDAINDYTLTSFDIVRRTLLKRFAKGTPQRDILNNDKTIHNVQKERNNLAHQKDHYEEGRLILRGKTDMEYNFDEFIRVRKDLLQANSEIDTHFKQ